jgi:hypothetical protein
MGPLVEPVEPLDVPVEPADVPVEPPVSVLVEELVDGS